jgi:hypothetical protein
VQASGTPPAPTTDGGTTTTPTSTGSTP